MKQPFIATLSAAIRIDAALEALDSDFGVEFAPAYRNRRGDHYDAAITVLYHAQPLWQAHRARLFNPFTRLSGLPEALEARFVETMQAQLALPETAEPWQAATQTGEAAAKVAVTPAAASALEARVKAEQAALQQQVRAVALADVVSLDYLYGMLRESLQNLEGTFAPVQEFTFWPHSDHALSPQKLTTLAGKMVVSNTAQHFGGIAVSAGTACLRLHNDIGVEAVFCQSAARRAPVLRISPAAALFKALQVDVERPGRPARAFTTYADGAVRLASWD